MITPEWCRMMAAYNTEMNRRFYAAAARLPEPVRQQQAGVFFGSLHATLAHLLWADTLWIGRLDGSAGATVTTNGGATMPEDFAVLQAARMAMDARIAQWAGTVQAPALEGDLHWHSVTAGQRMSTPVAMAVTHMFLHQTHHRGQAHALLTRFGEDTGATDLPFVLG